MRRAQFKYVSPPAHPHMALTVNVNKWYNCPHETQNPFGIFEGMIIQQIVEGLPKGELAQNKAMVDVARALDGLGFERVRISRDSGGGFVGNLWGRVKWCLSCPFWRRRVRHGAVVVLQYTISCWHGALAFRLLDEKFKARKHLKIIALIHDVNRTDMTLNRLTDHEKRFFAMCDKILIHGENMRRFFIEHGVAEEKLVIFDLFDYLLDKSMPEDRADGNGKLVVNCCGNLSPHKCGCYRELKTIGGVEWRLYGPNASASYLSDNVHHIGAFEPDELPEQLREGWGLIWDGDSVETETGLFGVYQKFNHPHKTSLCLAAGLPLIVWNQSGVADFVLREGVGITVSSLRELPKLLTEITDAEYRDFQMRTVKLGNRLRTGHVVQEAVSRAVEGL